MEKEITQVSYLVSFIHGDMPYNVFLVSHQKEEIYQIYSQAKSSLMNEFGDEYDDARVVLKSIDIDVRKS